MHANAGPRPSFGFSSKRRSEEAQRHKGSTGSVSLSSVGHRTRRSEPFSCSNSSNIITTTTTAGLNSLAKINPATQPGRTLVRSHGPPSSYIPHHIASLQYGATPSSVRSLPLQSVPLSAAPSSTASTPRPSLSQSEILDGGFQHGYNPSISRDSSISHRNGSLSSYLLQPPTHHPEPSPVSCQNQTQKLNMKRLMSKPTAIALPERASSAMAFTTMSGFRDDSASMDDYQDIKSNSLDILRRSRRRSRSADIHSKAIARSSAVPSERGPSSPLPAHYGTRPRSSDNRAAHPSMRQSESSLVSPSSPVTPAAIIALKWMESQRHATVTGLITGEQSSSSSTAVNGRVVSTSSSSPTVRPTSSRTNDLATSHLNRPQEDAESATMSDTGHRLGSAMHARPSVEQDQDPFVTWALAEQQLESDMVHESFTADVGAGTTVAATMKELSRRVFGRRDRSREKHKAASHSHSYTFTSTPPSSFSIGTALPPTSAIGKLVSKAPLSAISRASTHERSRSFPRATKTSSSPITPQLAHGHVSHSTPEGGAALRRSGTVVLNDEETESPSQMLPWSVPLPSNGTQDVPNDAVMLQAHAPLLIPQPSARGPSTDATSPLPPMPRAHTPNTLKKRSRGNLRQKPSQSGISAPLPVGGDPPSPSNAVVSPTRLSSQATRPPVSGPEEVTTGSNGGKLRGLVRKLSSGGLKKSARSQSQHMVSPGGDISPATSSAYGHGGKEFIPPVPQIPKDFELILDPEAYLAGRAKRLERTDSDGDSTAAHGTLSPQQVPSRKSSRCPSPAPPIQQRSTDPAPFATTETPVRIPHRANTDPTQTSMSYPESKSLTLAMPVPDSSRGTYIFPKRPKPMQELSSSQGSTSYSMSGTDHGHATFGYRSSSPSPSSSDMHHGRLPATSLDDAPSSSSYYQEIVSKRAHGIGQAIIPPRELYRMGEDEAANIRSRQAKDATVRQPRIPRKPVIAIPFDQVRSGDQADDVPPPTLSPELLPSLSAPPPRPPRRREVKSKSSLPSSPTSAPASKPTHAPRQRSISSPVSPVLPTFLTNKAVNAIPLLKRVRSVSTKADAPPETLEVALQDTQPSVLRSKSRSSVKGRANTLPPLVLTPTLQADAMFSGLNKDDDGRGARVQTSTGTITRAKSMFSSKSTLTTPNTSSSYVVSPQSAGRRSTSTRTSTEHHSSPADGDPPPVPFTSTAFTFKELTVTPSPRNKPMNEMEREEMWNELLVKSDLAGGTLSLTRDKKDGLLSDNASFISSQ